MGTLALQSAPILPVAAGGGRDGAPGPRGLLQGPWRGDRTVSWEAYLRQVPSTALEAELHRRDDANRMPSPIAIGPDLLVDPVSGIVTWKFDSYILSARRIEVVYTLATFWLRGCRSVRGHQLAQQVFRGFTRHEAHRNLLTTIHEIRARIPDLILHNGASTGYRFNVDLAVIAQRVPAPCA